jgi:hypothetical protein
MDLVELGARSMDLVGLEFLELWCLAGKKWSGAVFVDLELRGALPNTPLGRVVFGRAALNSKNSSISIFFLPNTSTLKTPDPPKI